MIGITKRVESIQAASKQYASTVTIKRHEIFPQTLIADGVYHYIWQRPEGLESTHPCHLPHTVLFKNSIANQWYFSDREGRVRKRNKEKVTTEEILKVFTRNPPKCGIVAQLLYPTCCENEFNPRSGTIAKHTENRLSYITHDTRAKMRYLDSAELCDFLEGRLNITAGVLQQFVEPAHAYNSVIQVTFTPSVCLFQQRSARMSLNNSKTDKYERLCTFDGPEGFSAGGQAHIKRDVAAHVKQQVDGFVQHFCNLYQEYETSLRKVHFYFKLDKQQRAWFLYAGGVHANSLRDASVFVASEPVVEVPDLENLVSLNENRPVPLRKSVFCIKCNRKTKREDFVLVRYSDLIEEKQRTQEDTSLRTDGFALNKRLFAQRGLTPPSQNEVHAELLVPQLFCLLYPNLTAQAYAKLVQDAEFRAREIRVCRLCYLDCQETRQQVRPSISVVGAQKSSNSLQNTQQSTKLTQKILKKNLDNIRALHDRITRSTSLTCLRKQNNHPTEQVKSESDTLSLSTQKRQQLLQDSVQQMISEIVASDTEREISEDQIQKIPTKKELILMTPFAKINQKQLQNVQIRLCRSNSLQQFKSEFVQTVPKYSLQSAVRCYTQYDKKQTFAKDSNKIGSKYQLIVAGKQKYDTHGLRTAVTTATAITEEESASISKRQSSAYAFSQKPHLNIYNSEGKM